MPVYRILQLTFLPAWLTNFVVTYGIACSMVAWESTHYLVTVWWLVLRSQQCGNIQLKNIKFCNLGIFTVKNACAMQKFLCHRFSVWLWIQIWKHSSKTKWIWPTHILHRQYCKMIHRNTHQLLEPIFHSHSTFIK